MEEEGHDVGVGVGVVQCEPDSTIRVESCDHGQPRTHQRFRHIGTPISESPNSTNMTGLVEPGLVDVDDPTIKV